MICQPDNKRVNAARNHHQKSLPNIGKKLDQIRNNKKELTISFNEVKIINLISPNQSKGRYSHFFDAYCHQKHGSMVSSKNYTAYPSQSNTAGSTARSNSKF
jgi:hypothetical protein